MSENLSRAGTTGPNVRFGAGLAVGGWALAAIPVMALFAYLRLADDCASPGSATCPGPTESGSTPMVLLAIACMVLGPLFLGVAAATKKRWARWVTALLALPVIFVGYDLLTDTFL